MGKVDHDAAELLRDQGVAALAFAQARALECLYYCDEPGHAYWRAIGSRVAANRSYSPNCRAYHN